MRQPPLLPEETLARVLRIAQFDGMTVLLLATFFAIVSAVNGHMPFAVVGLLGAGAGAIELHGAALLRHGDPRGMAWVTASQPFLWLVLVGYCALRLTLVEISPLPSEFQAVLAERAAAEGLSREELLRTINRTTVFLLLPASLLCLGGMTIFYLRRRRAVRRALETD